MMRNSSSSTAAASGGPPPKANEVLLAAVGQIMHRHPNASEDLVRTTLYSKHPDAARFLAKTPSFEHESRIVRTAIAIHQRQSDNRRQQPAFSQPAARRSIWIG